jgi:hypothetical protein
MRSTLLVLAATSFTLWTSRPAEACSLPPCSPGAFVPRDHGRVPANVPALYWRPLSGYELTADPNNVVLANAADPTTAIPFTAKPLASGDFLIVPDAPLAPGGYVIVDHTMCEDFNLPGPQAAFTVAAEAPLPSMLVPLVATPTRIQQMDLETRAGSCSVQSTVAASEIGLAPTLVADPWFDALHFETLVDGNPWHYRAGLTLEPPPGESPIGRGRDRVFQVCSRTDPTVDGLPAGKHMVAMRATLPGSTLVVMSEAIEVTLECDNPVGELPIDGPIGGSGGCSTGAGAGPALGLALLALLGGRRRARGGRGGARGDA